MFKKKLVAFLAGISLVATTLAGVAVSPAAAAPAASPAIQAPPRDTVDTLPTLPKKDKKDKRQKGTAAKKGLPRSGGISTFSVCGSPCYYYAGARRDNATAVDGVSVNAGVYTPIKDGTGYHTLGEVTAQKDIGGQMNAVEAGWTVDPTVNGGSSDPHFFVYHWVAGAPTCYNGCGWVDYAPNITVNAGTNLSGYNGVQKRIRILHYSGVWWVGFDNDWVGYFPDSEWTNAGVVGFTNTTYQQAFGEVAASDTTTGTDMGNGVLATTLVGARMGSLNKYVGTTPSLVTYTSNYATAPTRWAYAALSGSTFNYGGPG